MLLLLAHTRRYSHTETADWSPSVWDALGAHRALTADCTDRDELGAAFAAATSQLGPLRVVVAAVGGMGYTGGRGAGEEVNDAGSFAESEIGGGFADIVQTTQFATCKNHPQ